METLKKNPRLVLRLPTKAEVLEFFDDLRNSGLSKIDANETNFLFFLCFGNYKIVTTHHSLKNPENQLYVKNCSKR